MDYCVGGRSSDDSLALWIIDGTEHIKASEPYDQEDESTRLRHAAEAFEAASQLAPDEPWIWFQLGWVTLNSTGFLLPGAIEKARSALQRVLALDPNNPCAHFALGLSRPEARAVLVRWRICLA